MLSTASTRFYFNKEQSPPKVKQRMIAVHERLSESLTRPAEWNTTKSFSSFLAELHHRGTNTLRRSRPSILKEMQIDGPDRPTALGTGSQKICGNELLGTSMVCPLISARTNIPTLKCTT